MIVSRQLLSRELPTLTSIAYVWSINHALSRDPRGLFIKRRNCIFLVLLGAESHLPETGIQKRALHQQSMLLLYVVALECHIVNEATTKLKGKRLQPGWQSLEAFRVANRDHYEVGTAALDQSSQTR